MDYLGLAGLSVPILGLAAPLLVTWMVLRHRRQRTERVHLTVLALADKGMPVPAALLEPEGSRRSAYQTPFTLIGAGVGLAACGALLGGDLMRFGSPLGLLPICIGLAQLIAVRLDRNDTRRHAEPPLV